MQSTGHSVPSRQPERDHRHLSEPGRQFDPDVVVYLARSDTLDTELDGSWQHVGEPSFDFWAQARYDQAITALSARGPTWCY